MKGLDLGADDYMAKPFSLQELEARVRALTQHSLGSASTLISTARSPSTPPAGWATSRPDDRSVGARAESAGGAAAALGRLVSKDQLVERLCAWGEEVSNNAIERKKIEQGPVRIATVRGLGYCLEKIPSP